MIVKVLLVTVLGILTVFPMQIPEFQPTPENLGVVTGIFLSLLFGFIPGFATWFDKLGKNPDGTDDGGVTRSLFMLGLLAVVSLAIFGMSCSGILYGVACSKDGAVGLFWIFVYAVSGNQITYIATRKLSKAVKPTPPEDTDPRYTSLGKTQYPDSGEDR